MDAVTYIWIGLGVYFALGVLALTTLELLTGRIRDRILSASADTQTLMVRTGTALGSKSAILLTVGALWLFWPVAIYSALCGGDNKGEQ